MSSDFYYFLNHSHICDQEIIFVYQSRASLFQHQHARAGCDSTRFLFPSRFYTCCHPQEGPGRIYVTYLRACKPQIVAQYCLYVLYGVACLYCGNIEGFPRLGWVTVLTWFGYRATLWEVLALRMRSVRDGIECGCRLGAVAIKGRRAMKKGFRS
jgi:hypothetical protein